MSAQVDGFNPVFVQAGPEDKKTVTNAAGSSLAYGPYTNRVWTTEGTLTVGQSLNLTAGKWFLSEGTSTMLEEPYHETADALDTRLDVLEAGGSGIAQTIVDAKGDLIVGTAADTVARRAVGTNDQVLTADSAESTGVRWADGSAERGFAWPAALALKGASYDPLFATTSQAPGSGVFRATGLFIPKAATVTNLLLGVSTGGVTLTYARLGLYKLDGTMIAQTASQTATWDSTGLKTMALTAESGQSLTLAAGAYVVGLLAVGATAPQVVGTAAVSLALTAMASLGFTAPAVRVGYRGGQATLMNPLVSLTQGEDNSPWVGAS